MKKLNLLFLTLFLTNSLISQSGDSLFKRQQKEINDINLRMENFSIQNSTGNSLIIGGIALSTLSSIIAFKSPANTRTFKRSMFFVGVGTTLSLTGIGINMDSHNRLRKISRKEKKQNYYNNLHNKSYINRDGVIVNYRD